MQVQPARQPAASQSATQPVSQARSQPASQQSAVSRSAGQQASQPASQKPASQPAASQSATQPAGSQPASQPAASQQPASSQPATSLCSGNFIQSMFSRKSEALFTVFCVVYTSTYKVTSMAPLAQMTIAPRNNQHSDKRYDLYRHRFISSPWLLK